MFGSLCLSSVLLWFALLNASTFAEMFHYRDCAHHEVSKVDIVGCVGSGAPNSCAMKKGGQFTLSIDFVANQDSDKVTYRMTANLGGVEIPVPGVDSDACHHLKCPLVKGQSYQFKFPFNVPSLLPLIQTVVGAELTGAHGPLACVKMNGSVVD